MARPWKYDAALVIGDQGLEALYFGADTICYDSALVDGLDVCLWSTRCGRPAH